MATLAVDIMSFRLSHVSCVHVCLMQRKSEREREREREVTYDMIGHRDEQVEEPALSHPI